jgi:hypothetical protein
MQALAQFKESLAQQSPPADLSVYLQSLWYDAKGEWNKAHSLVDSLNDKTACWVHAYLHRKEGDKWNANYWYTKAGKTMPADSLTKEWEQIAEALL